MRAATVLSAALAAAAVWTGIDADAGPFVVEPASLAAAPMAPWAFAPLVWLPSRHANQSSATAYLDAYESRKITVGAYNIDRCSDCIGVTYFFPAYFRFE
jgi:hypothetical protein